MREFLQFERGAKKKKTKSNPWDRKPFLLKEVVKGDNKKKGCCT